MSDEEKKELDEVIEETKTEETNKDTAENKKTNDENDKTDTKDKSSKNTATTDNKIMIGIIIVLAIIIIALIVAITKKDKKSDKKPSENTTAQESVNTNSDVIPQDNKDLLNNNENVAEVELAEQWEGEGVFFGKITVDIYNGTKQELKNWTVEIPVDDGVLIDSGWNCQYEIKDGKLILKPAEYNVSIAANTKLSDIGLILKGNKKDNIENLSKVDTIVK